MNRTAPNSPFVPAPSPALIIPLGWSHHLAAAGESLPDCLSFGLETNIWYETALESIRIVAMTTVRCDGERLWRKGAEEGRKVGLSSGPPCTHTHTLYKRCHTQKHRSEQQSSLNGELSKVQLLLLELLLHAV